MSASDVFVVGVPVVFFIVILVKLFIRAVTGAFVDISFRLVNFICELHFLIKQIN